MHFLGGERIFIKPINVEAGFEAQLEDCLLQLQNYNRDLTLYKLNVFVESPSRKHYETTRHEIKQRIERQFASSFLLTVLAQPPLTSHIILEAFFYNNEEWVCKTTDTALGATKHFYKEGTEFLLGTVQSNEPLPALDNAKKVFKELRNQLKLNLFSVNTIIRQWNYIEGIIAEEGIHQNYQDFNDVRTEMYGAHFNECGYPAATGIGINQGGIIIEFIAMRSTSAITSPIDNKQQISAHHYSKDVLKGACSIKTTPKFERARYLKCFNHGLIFISGTASILGEETIGINDPAKQTEITIRNIRQLYSRQVIDGLSISNKRPTYGHARVYVKKEKDFEAIRRVCYQKYGDLPMVFIKADVCREELLVEIEGEAVFENYHAV